MRNLKRALSLAVAAVMVIGMTVNGYGASYVDVSSSDNVEAIEVMQAVGVITGDDQGNFNPDQNVTRGEMAVIMANLLDLGIANYVGAPIPFTDVPDWAHAYVAACYANGVTGGTSATTYGTDEPVTAVQAGLMMLKALDYFQYQEDFDTNGGWILATISQAARIGLFDGIDAQTEEPLTRNEVAQLALNALESDMVDFTGDRGMEVTSSDGTTVYVGFVSKYGAIERRGETASENYAGSDSTTQGYRQLAEELFGSDLKKSDNKDDFDRPGARWSYKSRVIGTYASTPDLSYTVQVESGEIYDDLGLRDDVAAANVNVSVDGKPAASLPIEDGNDTDKFGAKGALTEVYYEESYTTSAGIVVPAEVTIVTVNTYVAKVAGDYDADDKELDLEEADSTNAPVPADSLTLSADDFDGLSSFSDGDYVLLTIANDEIKTIQAAEVVTGTVTTYTAGKNLTAGGEKYEYNATFNAPNPKNNNDYDLVLDNYGYVVFFDGVASSDDHVFVTKVAEVGGVDTTFEAKAYFVDGTSAEIEMPPRRRLHLGTAVPRLH